MIVMPSVVTPQWISFQPYPGLGCLFRPYPGPDAVFGLTQGQSLQCLLGRRLLCGLPRSCQAYRMAGAFWRSLAVSHWSSSAPYPVHLTRYWVVRPRWRWLMIRSTWNSSSPASTYPYWMPSRGWGRIAGLSWLMLNVSCTPWSQTGRFLRT